MAKCHRKKPDFSIFPAKNVHSGNSATRSLNNFSMHLKASLKWLLMAKYGYYPNIAENAEPFQSIAQMQSGYLQSIDNA